MLISPWSNGARSARKSADDEDLDRLSREAVPDALQQFMALIQAGIIIATLADRQIYSHETIGNDWTKLILSIAIMARAHEKSAMKAHRLAATWEKKRRDAPSKPMTARCPEWLHLRDGRFEILSERAAIVRRIFDQSIRNSENDKLPHGLTKRAFPHFVVKTAGISQASPEFVRAKRASVPSSLIGASRASAYAWVSLFEIIIQPSSRSPFIGKRKPPSADGQREVRDGKEKPIRTF